MSLHALLVATVVLLGACLVVVVLVAATKAGRAARLRRRAAALAPFRRSLVVVGAGEDAQGADRAALSAATGPAGHLVDRAVVDLLGKVRGQPAEDLVEVLRTHGAVERAKADLGHRTALTRARAARVLGVARDGDAVPALVEALADPAVEVRTSAAYALGLIGDPTAARAVLAAVGAPGAEVPAGIGADALLGMGIGISDAVLEAFRAGSPQVRTVAAYVSGVGAFRRSVGPLRELLCRDEDLTVRETSATALGSIGAHEDVDVLAEHTGPDHPLALRRICAEALGDLGEVAAVPHLAGLLSDPDPRLAEVAATALLRLGPSGRAAVVPVEDAEALSAEAGFWDPVRGLPVATAVTVAELRGQR